MVEGKHVAWGIAGASAVLFVVELARVPDLRKAPVYSAAGQTDLDAFITAVLTFVGMGVVIDWTGEALANPKELGF